MISNDQLIIAIASDLHAYDDYEGDNAPSHLRITDPEDQPGRHPITGLIKLIEEDNLSAHLLLCPGDLGHKAKPAPLKYAWQSLQKIKSALQAESLIATAGNHDLDSRYTYNSYDAKGLLQSLAPPFPLDDDDLNNVYWARNFAIIQHKHYNLIVLNSSAYHGTAPDEINHGRAASSTISALEQRLRSIEAKNVNILLCHHHPQMHTELNLGDYDTMKNGQALLDLLGRGSYGRWIIVHGHKHHPKLTYASGGATSPIVFSAGSLSATLYRELSASVRNQFYIMEIPLNKVADLGLAGTVRAWDWAPSLGWSKAGTGSGLPPICGFGFRGDPATITGKIRDAMDGPKSSWEKIRAAVPEVNYMLPQDFATLRKELERSDLILQDFNGAPHEIGVRL